MGSILRKKIYKDKPKFKARYRVKQSLSGTFVLSPAKGSPVIQRKLENTQPNTLSKMQTNLEFFHDLEKSVTRPENTLLKITPEKRKLMPVVEGTRTPVSISFSWSSNSTRETTISESPAKRQRSCRHRGDGQN